MTVNRGLFTSATDRWFTPPELLDEVRAFLGDYYDPCPAIADGEPAVDGLSTPWASGAEYISVFTNPPYGRAIGKWVEKWIREPFTEGVLLVPARTDTAWWQGLWVYSICFIRGRLRFEHAGQTGKPPMLRTPAPFPSALAYKGPRAASFADAFGHRGPVTRAMWTPRKWRAA